MIDPDDLAAIAEAALDEHVETLFLPVAPGLALELAYDAWGLLSAIWQAGPSWRVVEIGEA